jgi:hypothetical protein
MQISKDFELVDRPTYQPQVLITGFNHVNSKETIISEFKMSATWPEVSSLHCMCLGERKKC